MNKRLFIKISSIFIVFTIVIITLSSLRYSYERTQYLKKITTQNFLNYHTIYNKYKDISNIIFNTQINKEEILSLLKMLKQMIKKIKILLGKNYLSY